MRDALYEDDKCEYVGGDPRFPVAGDGTLRLTAETIEFEPDDDETDKLYWPRSAVQGIRYVPWED
jgi:hypothetical protein